jgi:hypothetical protein
MSEVGYSIKESSKKGETMDNKIQITWTRSDFERVVGRTLSDKEWEVLASEVESDAEEVAIPELINSKFEIIEHLVEQDKKYD